MPGNRDGAKRISGSYGLRGEHWALKLLIAGVGLALASPFAIGIASALADVAPLLAVLWVVAVLAPAAWFVFTSPVAGIADRVAELRYCESCGNEVLASATACPVCGGDSPMLPDMTDTGAAARFMNMLAAERRGGRIDARSYLRIYQAFQARLSTVRTAPPSAAPDWEAAPRWPSSAAGLPPVTATATPSHPRTAPLLSASAAPAGTVQEPSPATRNAEPFVARPRRPGLGEVAIGWAAERQADILLYVGGFLLSVAAIIFVASAGEAISGGVRFTVLTVYAAGFLLAGLLLHRWERVKEAGPVFLAIGAILVPIAFVSLRTQVLSQEQLATDWLWLLGAVTSAALYFGLAARGYGWLYALPGAAAGLIAWAALGFVIDLPAEWFGPWFAALAAVAYVASTALLERRRAAKWVLLASGAVGVVSLAWTHGAVAVTGEQAAALPSAYLAVTAGLVVSIYWRRPFVALMALPPAAAMTALTATWAATGMGTEWYGVFAAGAAAGYLLLAWLDAAQRLHAWAYLGAAAGAVALVGAHVFWSAETDPAKSALPVTYAAVLGVAALGAVWWRFEWRLPVGTLPLLTAGTAITALWAWAELAPEWYGAFIAASALGYVLIALTDAARMSRPWLWAGGAACAAGLALAQGWQLAPGVERAALPLSYGLALVAAALVVVRWRLECREFVAAVPPLTAALGLSLGWASFEMSLEWAGAWVAVAAGGYAIAAIPDRRMQANWMLASLAAGAGALVLAHAAAVSGEIPGQLPVTYGVLVAGWLPLAVLRRGLAVLVPVLLCAPLGAAILWAAGAGEQWWAYPAIGVAAAMMATRAWWMRDRELAPWAGLIPVALAVAATIAVLPADYNHPVHGVVVQLLAAALMLVASFEATGGVFARVNLQDPGDSQRAIEMAVLTQACFAFLFGAAASLNQVLEISGPERAWTFFAVATVGWMLSASGLRGTAGLWTFLPVGLAGSIMAALLAAESDAIATTILVCATLSAVAAFVATRRWMLLGIADLFLLLGVWTGWRWMELETLYLGLAYAAIAIVQWSALALGRRYSTEASEADYAITYLSWTPWLVAGAVSALLLNEHSQEQPGQRLASSEEWALAAVVLALGSAAVTAEGIRFHQRWAWLAGTTGLLAALLMGIATLEPANVQAYSAPIGVYLILAGLAFRTSPAIFRDDLYLHEAAMLAGCMFLVVPAAEQALESDGGMQGLELLGIGLGLLIVGLVLHARWLVPAGILTVTATAVRMVTGGMFSAPYWLLLGLAGTVLVGFGLLVLLERERWDALRRAVVQWWHGSQRSGLSPKPHP